MYSQIFLNTNYQQFRNLDIADIFIMTLHFKLHVYTFHHQSYMSCPPNTLNQRQDDLTQCLNSNSRLNEVIHIFSKTLSNQSINHIYFTTFVIESFKNSKENTNFKQSLQTFLYILYGTCKCIKERKILTKCNLHLL